LLWRAGLLARLVRGWRPVVCGPAAGHGWRAGMRPPRRTGHHHRRAPARWPARLGSGPIPSPRG